MRNDTWLATASKQLSAAGIESARLDCLLLLEDELGCDRAWLLAHPEAALTSRQIGRLNKKVIRRELHEPMAYIRGKVAFFGHDFSVDRRVLVPRPESEAMLEALTLLPLPPASSRLPDRPLIVDAGTGSGALAIAAKLARPQAEVYGTDISRACLTVARRNARALHAEVRFLESDLLASLEPDTQPDIILANLPYVPDAHAINEAARHEPALAIFGGADGMKLYRRLWSQCTTKAWRPSWILTEALLPDHSALAAIAAEHGYRLARTQGLCQVWTPAD